MAGTTVEKKTTHSGKDDRHSKKNGSHGDGLKDKGWVASSPPTVGITVIALFTDLIAFTIILPLMPSILKHYEENDTSGAYKVVATYCNDFGKWMGAPARTSENVLIGGILGSLFCLLQFVSAPIVGAYSDVYGRKRALIICMVGICISHVMWLFANSFLVFILARVVGGLSRANVSISTTIVADDSPPEKRPKGMALIGIAFSAGFTIGPMIGAYFAKSGEFHVPAFICLNLSLLSLMIIIYMLEETLEKKYRKKALKLSNASSYIWPPYLFQFKPVSVKSKLIPIGVVYFMYIFIYSGLEFTLTFLTDIKFGFTPKDQGKMFLALGVAMAALQGSVTRRLTPSMLKSAAASAIFMLIPGFILLGICNDIVVLATGLLWYSVASAVVGPSLTALVTHQVDKSNELGVALGIFRSLGALARGFGPLFASYLFWTVGPVNAYLLGAIFLVIPLIYHQMYVPYP